MAQCVNLLCEAAAAPHKPEFVLYVYARVIKILVNQIKNKQTKLFSYTAIPLENSSKAWQYRVMATRASASKVNSTPYWTFGFPPSSTGASESSLYLDARETSRSPSQRTEGSDWSDRTLSASSDYDLPDQPQRILPDVHQAPQGFHRLVRRRRHVRKLVQKNTRVNAMVMMMMMLLRDAKRKTTLVLCLSVLTCTGLFPRKFRSMFSPKRYPSGCGVSNFSPPMKKWLAK